MEQIAIKARVIKALFDLSRGKQALLSVAQPGLGAMLAAGGSPPARVFALGIPAALAGFLAVFSLNDVLDRKVDRKALAAGKAESSGFDIDVTFLRHPLALNEIALSLALVWVVSLAMVSAILAYMLNPLCLALFAGCAGLEVLYCSLRSVSWLKTLLSGVMVGLGGLAGWVAVAPLNIAALLFFIFLALWEVFGRNLPNDLADVKADSKVGIKTVAVIFGNRIAARATLIGALATLAWVMALPMTGALVLAALAVGVWSMGLPAVRLALTPTSEEASSYFNRASAYPALIFLVVLFFSLTRWLK